MYEIISTKLLYGISTQNANKQSIDFVKLFDTEGVMGGQTDYSPKTMIECYKYDPLGKIIKSEMSPVYVAGITVGSSMTKICHIKPEVLDTAQKIFNEAVIEFNEYMNKLGTDYKIKLEPELLLFGEGFIKNGQ